MDFKDYQRRAYHAVQEHDGPKEEEMHWAIGLGEEAGEVLGVVKHKYYGGQYAVEDMVEEMGDVLWHLSSLCVVLGISLEDVAEYNIAKLVHRYPTGDFDECRSQARHELAKQFKTCPERLAIVERVRKAHAAHTGQ